MGLLKSNNEAYKHRLKLIWTFEIKNNVGISQLKYQKNMFNSMPDMVCFAAIHSKFDNS